MHRSPANFSPLPNEFWPERWLTQEQYTLPSGETITPEQVVTNRAAFLPFSAGQQVCAGRSLAVMEMRAVVCAFADKFDMEVAQGFKLENWETDVRDCFLTKRGPLLVRLQARMP